MRSIPQAPRLLPRQNNCAHFASPLPPSGDLLATSSPASRRWRRGPPTGPQWVHETKHDGYRLMVRKQGDRVLYAFDLLELEGEDFPPQPLHVRKARLEQLLSAAPAGIKYNETDRSCSTPAAWAWRGSSRSAESTRTARPAARPASRSRTRRRRGRPRSRTGVLLMIASR
jgi:hypothetical protein